MKKRFRPTFLLRCVFLAITVGCLILALKLFDLGQLTATPILIMLALIFIFAWLESVPDFLEYILVRRAERKDKACCLWFIDVSLEEKRAFEKHIDETSDNPTLR